MGTHASQENNNTIHHVIKVHCNTTPTNIVLVRFIKRFSFSMNTDSLLLLVLVILKQHVLSTNATTTITVVR